VVENKLIIPSGANCRRNPGATATGRFRFARHFATKAGITPLDASAPSEDPAVRNQSEKGDERILVAGRESWELFYSQTM
jgi:hypothetical protein